MAKDFADQFYRSRAWKRCKDNYLKSVGGLCERCRANGLITPARIVHHKTYLTPENIKDSSISLNWDNLEALCKQCHEDEHNNEISHPERFKKKRYLVDEYGRITI